jgi:hypothetical protein
VLISPTRLISTLKKVIPKREYPPGRLQDVTTQRTSISVNLLLYTNLAVKRALEMFILILQLKCLAYGLEIVKM